MKSRRIILLAAMLMVFSVAFAQTNAQVSFIIIIDTVAPEYSNYTSNTSTIDSINQSVLLSAYWTDNLVGLDYYYFESNNTGVFMNSSAQSFVNGWSNQTLTFNNASLEGSSVYYSFHASDTNRNWNSTYYKSISLTSEAPEYYNVESNNTLPSEGELVLLSSYWTDNFNVYKAALQTRISGEWLDNQTIYVNNQTGWANFTWNTTGYAVDTVIEWRIQGFDNATNTNTTLEYNFTIK